MEALAVDRAVLQSFFLIIIFIMWKYQPKECSGPSVHSRENLLETFVHQKMLEKTSRSVTAGLDKKHPKLCYGRSV